MIEHVRKRTGEILPFQQEKIRIAIEKAMAALIKKNRNIAQKYTEQVINL